MRVSGVPCLRFAVLLSTGVVVGFWLWLLGEVGTYAQTFDPTVRLFASSAGVLLPWWKTVFLFVALLGVLLLTLGSLWVGLGLVVVIEAYLLSFCLDRREMEIVFTGFRSSLLRGVVGRPLHRLIGDIG